MKLIDIGRVVNTHGLKGDVKIVPWLDYPEVFEMFEAVYTEDGSALHPSDIRYQKSNLIVRFSEIGDINQAEKLKNKILYADRAYFDNLPDGTYLIADIIGLRVYEDDLFYGTVTDVFSTGGSDVYVVEKDGQKPLLIPIIDGVLQSVDIAGGTIRVKLPDGLLDL